MCLDVALRCDTFGNQAVDGAPFVALGAGVEGRAGPGAAGVTVGHVIGLTDNARMRR